MSAITYKCECCDIFYEMPYFSYKQFRKNRNNHCDKCAKKCRYIDARGAHHYYGVRYDVSQCRVVRYPCGSNGCKTEIKIKGGFCKPCTCQEYWCANKKVANSLYCLGHTCSTNECFNHTLYGSNYCNNHTCKAKDCSEEVVPGLPYCDNHRCIDCSDSKCLNLRYSCRDAILCISSGCHGQRMPHSQFCSEHKCHSCNEELATCYEHTCRDMNCIRARMKGSKYCDTCTCAHPGCMRGVRSHRKYCYLHGCAFCGNEVSRFIEVREVFVRETFLLRMNDMLPGVLSKMIAHYISNNGDRIDDLICMRRSQMEDSKQCDGDIEREMNLYRRSMYEGSDINVHHLFNNDNPSIAKSSFTKCSKCANRMYCSGDGAPVDPWEDAVYCQGFGGSCGHIVAYGSKRCQCCTHRWLREQGKEHKSYSMLAVIDYTI